MEIFSSFGHQNPDLDPEPDPHWPLMLDRIPIRIRIETNVRIRNTAWNCQDSPGICRWSRLDCSGSLAPCCWRLLSRSHPSRISKISVGVFTGEFRCCGSATFWYGSGSVPLTDLSGSRSGSGSCFFRQWQQKRSHKIVEIKVFLTFLLADGRIRIRTK